MLYCSKLCSSLARGKRKKNNCEICGKEFIYYVSSRNSSRFCSPICANKNARGKEKPSIQKENSPNWKGGHTLIQKICLDCGKKIYYRSIRCHSCSKKSELHPHWLGGIGKFPYPFEFNDELKDMIRARDNYNCQLCGISEEEHILIKGMQLHIHHIDYNKDNCFENNLISLCHQCHARTNYNREHWSYKLNDIIRQTNLTYKEM